MSSQGALFVAVVHAADGVRFATATASRQELMRRLAEYAGQRAAHVLRPEHAHQVRALLARGELDCSIEVYFGFVGELWDEEWLVTSAVADEDRAAT